MAVAPIEVRQESELQPPAPTPVGNEPRKPTVSYRLSSDCTTSIAVSVRVNTYKNAKGKEYEQLSTTVQRSYLDAQNQWQTQSKPTLRAHVCLIYLLQKAHSFALERRTADSSIPF